MIPASVIAAATGQTQVTLIECVAKPLARAGGLATARLDLLSCVVEAAGVPSSLELVLKELVAPAGSRHDLAARNPRHWAYWRREALAYSSGLLPADPEGLAAPRCFGVEEAGDRVRIYLPYVVPAQVDPGVAAGHLGRWNARVLRRHLPRSGWLAGPSIARRVTDGDRAGGLEWSELPIPTVLTHRLRDLWEGRHQLLTGLGRVPRALVHGDYHLGNLVSAGQHTVVLDWATLGRAPLGTDLATLVVNFDLPPDGDIFCRYQHELEHAVEPQVSMEAEFGYLASAVLAGVSRLHWALVREQRLANAAAWIDWFAWARDLAMRRLAGKVRAG